jgi:N-methylhydantoinase A
VFIARRLGCRELLIPETGAAMSAAGAMMSDIAAEFAVTTFASTASFDLDRADKAIADVRRQAEAFIERAQRAGSISYVAEARYEGQAWDIDVPLDSATFATEDDVARFRAAFDATHEQLFTIRDESSAVELIGLRARVSCPARSGIAFRLKGDPEATGEARSRPVYFSGHGWIETPVLRWDAMAAEQPVAGPALIESAFTTIVVDPPARFRRTADGSILIEA